jgi:hypothetical protein
MNFGEARELVDKVLAELEAVCLGLHSGRGGGGSRGHWIGLDWIGLDVYGLSLRVFVWMTQIHFNFFSIWFYVNTRCVYVKLIVDFAFICGVLSVCLDASEINKTYENVPPFVYSRR